jgi:hypothetical protein
MANTTNSKASSKHRAKKKKITIRNQSNLAHAKKKTLEELHALGRCPKHLLHRLGIKGK